MWYLKFLLIALPLVFLGFGIAATFYKSYKIKKARVSVSNRTEFNTLFRDTYANHTDALINNMANGPVVRSLNTYVYGRISAEEIFYRGPNADIVLSNNFYFDEDGNLRERPKKRPLKKLNLPDWW